MRDDTTVDTTPLAERALDTLTDLNRFVRWQEDQVLDSKGKPVLKADGTPKRTKCPYIPVAGGGRASSTNATTWGSFDEALEASPDNRIGIMLGDLGDGFHLCGLDLDASIMPDGEVAKWAILFLNLLSVTYGEVSPSGRGIKFFFFIESAHIGECLRLFGIDDGRHGRRITIGEATLDDHPPGVEFYTSHRFFTMTGGHWPDSADDIATLGPDIIGGHQDGAMRIYDLFPIELPDHASCRMTLLRIAAMPTNVAALLD